MSILCRLARCLATTGLLLLAFAGGVEPTKDSAPVAISAAHRDGPKRQHRWDSGWVSEAVELLAADRTKK